MPSFEPISSATVDGTLRSTAAARDWQRRPSPLARYAFVVFTLLVIDASLYPLVGWRDIGVPAFAYLDVPWPTHALEFDMLVNVLGYAPLGALALFAMYPRLKGPLALLLATAYSGALSACLEAAQTFLPSRVASKVDLVTNIVGALLGALFAALATRPVLEGGRLREWRRLWFSQDASRGLVVCVLWLGSILYPEQFALGCGGFLRPFQLELQQWFGLSLSWELTSQEFALAEAATTAALLGAAGLLFLNLMRPRAPRLRLVLVFVATTILAKTMGTGMTYANVHPLVWVSSGAVAGLGFGTLFLALAVTASPRARAWAAIVLLLVVMVLTNVIPENPYFEAASGHWAYGRFLNFYGLAYGLSMIWPLVALGYILRRGRMLWVRSREISARAVIVRKAPRSRQK